MMRLISLLLLLSLGAAFAPALSEDFSDLIKRVEAASGVSWSALATPFLYRGDTRPPGEIFHTGFRRQPGEPKITDIGESRNLVATSTELIKAIGFADDPSIAYTGAPKRDFSYVYLIHSDKGFDLRGRHYGAIADEITLVDVPPEQIIAAMRIRTTENWVPSYTDQHVPIREPMVYVDSLELNPSYNGPKGYETQLKPMIDGVRNKYVTIPYRSFDDGRTDPNAVLNQRKVLLAVKRNLSMEDMIPLSEIALGLYATGKYPASRLHGINNETQLQGILEGMSPEEVTRPSFNMGKLSLEGQKHLIQSAGTSPLSNPYRKPESCEEWLKLFTK